MPVAAITKVAVFPGPAQSVWACGCVVMVGPGARVVNVTCRGNKTSERESGTRKKRSGSLIYVNNDTGLAGDATAGLAPRATTYTESPPLAAAFTIRPAACHLSFAGRDSWPESSWECAQRLPAVECQRGSAASESAIGVFPCVVRRLRCGDDRQVRSAPSSTIHWCSG